MRIGSRHAVSLHSHRNIAWLARSMPSRPQSSRRRSLARRKRFSFWTNRCCRPSMRRTYPHVAGRIVPFDPARAGDTGRNDEGGLHVSILWIILIVILILALLGFFSRGRW